MYPWIPFTSVVDTKQHINVDDTKHFYILITSYEYGMEPSYVSVLAGDADMFQP